MRRKVVFLMIFLLVLFVLPTFAQVNGELVDSLNEARIFEIKSKKQCEYHSVEFDIIMPYHQILLDKEDSIRLLENLIVAIGGELERATLNIEKLGLSSQALNRDAYSETELVRIYDKILAKFGHAEVRRVVQKARHQAIEHFMLLTNTAQSVIDQGRLDNRLKIGY